MFMKIFWAINLLALSLLSNANGAPWCRGKISHTYQTSGGDVYILGDWASNHTQICRITSVWKGVPIDVCKSWASIAVAAKLSQADVTVFYEAGNITDCKQIPTYGNAPAPGYLMLGR
jgi:hypothetical protein